MVCAKKGCRVSNRVSSPHVWWDANDIINDCKILMNILREHTNRKEKKKIKWTGKAITQNSGEIPLLNLSSGRTLSSKKRQKGKKGQKINKKARRRRNFLKNILY